MSSAPPGLCGALPLVGARRELRTEPSQLIVTGFTLRASILCGHPSSDIHRSSSFHILRCLPCPSSIRLPIRREDSTPPMASRLRASGSAPLYSLAAPLAVNTPSPAISLAGVWARSYPSSESPFRSTAGAALPPYINLAQGVPGQLPSQTLRAKFAEEASKDKHHSYTGASPALTGNLAKQLNQVYRDGREEGPGAITGNDVCISAGCNMACEFAFRTVAEPGTNDGIVLPTPYVSVYARCKLALAAYMRQLVLSRTSLHPSVRSSVFQPCHPAYCIEHSSSGSALCAAQLSARPISV